MNRSKHTGIHVYEIRIEGHLNAARTHEFENFRVVSLPEGQTLITGTALDQSAMFGLLIRIRDLGLSLISVTRKLHRNYQTNNQQTTIEMENLS